MQCIRKDEKMLMIKGSLMVTLHGQPNLAEHELGGLAGRYGDIRAIRPGPYPE